MAARAYDFLYKILLIGDPGVGKTSVLFRYTDDTFSTTFISCIGECRNRLSRLYTGSANLSELEPLMLARVAAEDVLYLLPTILAALHPCYKRKPK